MQFEYECVKHHEGVPIRSYFVNIGEIEFHWHSDIELMWVLKGTVRIQSSKGVFLLEKGDVFIVNTYEAHRLSNTGEDNLLLGLQINSEMSREQFRSLNELCFTQTYLNSNTDLVRKLRHIMSSIMLELQKGLPQNLLRVTGYTYTLVAELIDGISYELLNGSHQSLKHNDFERIQSIVTYINEHFSEKIQLQQLASMHYISRYHLSHFIKSKLGLGFQELLNSVRLAKAYPLIVGSDKTILEIAQLTGFSDVKYLTEQVKARHMVTPIQLRKAYKIEGNSYTTVEKNGHRPFDVEEGISLLKEI